LFVEELTKAVLESGLVREDTDAWRLDGPLPPLAIPSSLHDSLMARLDRMAPVKEVAQVGAAIGREFSSKLLAPVLDTSAPTLDGALMQLVEAGLLVSHGGEMYAFKHALTRDAAYASLLKSRRQICHQCLRPYWRNLTTASSARRSRSWWPITTRRPGISAPRLPTGSMRAMSPSDKAPARKWWRTTAPHGD
jgi:hypothetical protein